jgi:hypothetical protein
MIFTMPPVFLDILEYWSVGVLDKGLMRFYQHSNNPTLQYS